MDTMSVSKRVKKQRAEQAERDRIIKESERVARVLAPRAITKLHKILADKNVRSVDTKDGWTYITFANGQIFGCRGPVVDAALNGAPVEEKEKKKTKNYTVPAKGENITLMFNNVPGNRYFKRVYARAEFEWCGEIFIVRKDRFGGWSIDHKETGAYVHKTGGTLSAAVDTGIEYLNTVGKEKLFAAVAERKREIAGYGDIPTKEDNPE